MEGAFYFLTKNKMKMCCSSSCGDNPALAQCLVRIGVAGLFIVPGIIKLMDPSAFQAELGGMLGLTGLVALIVVWIVIVFEVLGSVFILAGPFVPRSIYKISLLGILVISIVALVEVHIPSGDMMKILFQSFATLVVASLCMTKPICYLKEGSCKM